MNRTVSLSAVQLAVVVAVAFAVGGVGAAMLDGAAPTPDDEPETSTVEFAEGE